ncbi:MAG: carbohydrate ABC transporter permease [Treponema sp.]|nr:carbohydrate ABC transporter permease [Treponema sp.]
MSAGKVLFWPIEFTLSSYEFALLGGKFMRAFFISMERVVLGVCTNMVMITLFAYPLSKSREKFRGRNLYMIYFVTTMIIGGGLIPTYLVVVKLGLLNSLWALILPGMMPVGSGVMLMNFMRQMPQDIEEAAIIDGAGVFYRLVRVLLPLLKPALATMALFSIVGHWNDWFGGMIYMQSPDRYPLQTYLQTLLTNIDQILRLVGTGDYNLIVGMINARTGRAAQLFLGAFPMLAIYPFLQKYFVKGLVIGSIKG